MIDGKGLTRRREDAKKVGEVGLSVKTDTLAASRLCGLSALCSGALGSGEGEGMMALVGGRGSVAPLGLVFMGGRNPALTRWAIVWRPSGPGKTRSCQGVSGSNPVLLRELSIPMPMPIPIPTRSAGVCRAGSSSACGVSVRRLRRMGTASFCDFL